MPDISEIGSVRTIVETALEKGVVDVVLSPGSRNSPLIISFNALEDFRCISIVDERTAGFMALGMSQQSKQSVLLCCTSGSAMLNYAPALAEAYYQNIPLIVITADRPAKWIDQGEGQSIRQSHLLDGILIKAVDLVNERSEDDAWYNRRLVNEAFESAWTNQKPVQINVPLNEPLYNTMHWERPLVNRGFSFVRSERLLSDGDLNGLLTIWSQRSRVMILMGQNSNEERIKAHIKTLSEHPNVAVLTESTANVGHFGLVSCIDRTLETFLGSTDEANFVPDLLITIGGNIISKKLKQFLRNHKADVVNHWHFGSESVDTFQSLTHIIDAHPAQILGGMSKSKVKKNSGFSSLWKGAFFKAEQSHRNFLDSAPYSDLKVFEMIMDFIPDEWIIQMGNSSVVRYIQLFNQIPSVKYFGNRGVSGIEGCTSTAVGAAMKTVAQVLLISGDHAFRYDANGLSFERLPANLRIVVINNGGGNIFRIIEGPSQHKTSDDFIEHSQNKSVKGLVEYHNVHYHSASNLEEIERVLPRFFSMESNACQVLEIFTPRVESPIILKEYFKSIKNG